MIWYLVIVIALLMLLFGMLFPIYGDDTEDTGKSKWIDRMLERVQEWNRQKAVNDTIIAVERFNASVCFNSQDLANEFYNQTGIVGIVPCPDFTISGPEDQSGK